MGGSWVTTWVAEGNVVVWGMCVGLFAGQGSEVSRTRVAGV